MNAIDSILAATDFSLPSRHAADRAARLAAETGARLTLMHAMPRTALDGLRQWLGSDSSTGDELIADARRSLQQIAGELASLHAVSAQLSLSTGAPVEEIVRQAEAAAAGLVVLGARGGGVLRRMALGSTAERLLRRIRLPLLVVKRTPHAPYRRAMVAVDFSRWSACALQSARAIAPQARLVLLNVFQVPFEGKLRFAGVDDATIEQYRSEARTMAGQQLKALAHDAGLKPGAWDACVVEGDAWMRIVEQEQAFDCDLVVIGKHGLSVAQELLLGSVTSAVLAEGSRDVLVSTAANAGNE